VAVDVSVCIATWRRPEGLARLLASLARQKLPDELSLEVLVVDNDALASAEPVLERFRAQLPLRAFREPRRNIAHARNRALDHARGRWLAFVDDDEEVHEGWLDAYWTRAELAEADGWFGPVLPRFAPGGATWLAQERLFGRPRPATGSELGVAQVSTSNAFVRRGLFEARRFDAAFGRSGGEDSELFGRCLRAGARLRWCDEAVVYEHVPAERQRLRWLAQRAWRGGVVATQLARRDHPGAAADGLRAARALLALALFSAAALAALCRGRVAAARAALRACTQAGHLFALCGGAYEEYRDP
jgi:succinoglycan biosynthesis protein ExoM